MQEALCVHRNKKGVSGVPFHRRFLPAVVPISITFGILRIGGYAEWLVVNAGQAASGHEVDNREPGDSRADHGKS